MKQVASLIQEPIDKLDLSESFKQMASQQHFRTLLDILNWPVSLLLLHEGFTFHIYEELIKFLKKNNLSVPVSGSTVFPIS